MKLINSKPSTLPENYEVEYSNSVPALFNPLDVYRERKRKSIVESKDHAVLSSETAASMGSSNRSLDFPQWLPKAAESLHISPRMEDYILVPVVAIVSDLPNRNGVGFPLKALTQFNVGAGQLAYQTWKGKPTYLEHQNTNPVESKGVIADVSLRPMKGFANGNVWKVVMLGAFDRTKDPELVKAILAGDMNSYSMGSYVEGYECSICNDSFGHCAHTMRLGTEAARPNVPVFAKYDDQHTLFKHAVGLTGFELSSVSDPAYRSAITDHLLMMKG